VEATVLDWEEDWVVAAVGSAAAVVEVAAEEEEVAAAAAVEGAAVSGLALAEGVVVVVGVVATHKGPRKGWLSTIVSLFCKCIASASMFSLSSPRQSCVRK